MELIAIRGKENGGKTTTAALVNNILVQKHKANPIGTWLDKKLAPVNGDKGETHDFHSVLELNGKVIVIISAGDDAPWLEKEMREMEGIYQPVVIVVCVRFRDDNFTMSMLKKSYKDLYENMRKKDNQVILQYTKDAEGKEKGDVKEKAEECVKKILEILNQETI